LVNQILDVRKIDKQQMHLHCRETDLVSFTNSICKMYDYTASERGITFVYPQEGDEPVKAWIDRRQMDKVVNNLLSNAFKYSYNGGRIELQLSAVTDLKAPEGAHPTHAELKVIDNGAGMDSEGMKHIFDRFYQGSNSRRLNIDGTGIGLNLCKMIVDMHSGTINASNRTDGERGSVFTVRIPLGNAHLKAEEMETTEETTEAIQLVGTPSGQHPQTKYRVLVVDDDMEVARYISQELGRYYRFGIAPNGKEGLRLLLTGDYDVVVSDVMMPEMDGFTMLRMIKTNLNISHLPVILLTSKADVGNRLEGLERGADAFLAKPFDMEELHMNIENCINTLLRLKGKFSGAQQQADRIEAPEVKGNDEELMERVMKVVNKHLGDSEFTVDQLTQEACISRTQLHRKMKEMTGLSTSEFIRNLRLEQAARLLKEQKINITQVAYTVGFSNVAHFSSVFRKHFGMTPTEYIKS
jgi:DNA-binding response OmpR family regulator